MTLARRVPRYEWLSGTKGHLSEEGEGGRFKPMTYNLCSLKCRIHIYMCVGCWIRNDSVFLTSLLTTCRPGIVDLPPETAVASTDTITLPEIFHDFETAVADLGCVPTLANPTTAMG